MIGLFASRMPAWLAAALCAMALGVSATDSFAQKDSAPGFPSRPVRLVVGFAAGGVLDIVGRMATTRMNEAWNVPVLLENRPGASGAIGMDMVAKSPPDGHVVGMLIVGHVVNSIMEGQKMPYDLLRDFTPVTHLVSSSYALSVNAGLPVRSVKELLAHARSHPGTVRFGSSGTGGGIHLAGEWFAMLGKVNLTHVPYKGNAQAMTDLAGGHIEMMITAVPLATTFAAQGRSRILGVTSAKRLASLPDIATVQEAGLPGYEVDGWYGIAGPKGIPEGVVEKLNQEMVRAMRLPEARDKLTMDGLQPVGSTPAQFSVLIQAEHAKWRGVILERGLAPK